LLATEIATSTVITCYDASVNTTANPNNGLCNPLIASQNIYDA
jgi:hypothetical protein